VSQPNGYVFRLDLMNGRFYPCGDGGTSAGEQTCVVTGAPNINAAATALNSAGAVPTPLASTRWQVAYADLALAIQQSTKAVLVPYAFSG
jgi:hypothetical protein